MPVAKTPVKVEVTHKTIIFTVFFIIALVILFQIRSLILFLFIALILMSALNPLIDRLEKYKIHRGLSTIILYIILWSFISFSIASLVPPLVEQSAHFLARLPDDVERLSQGRFDVSIFEPQLQVLPQNIFKIVVGAFNNVIGLFTLMVIVYYLILERKNLHKYLMFFFGNDGREDRAEAFIDKLEKRLGGWVRGELLLMLFVGLLSYVGLVFLGVEFAIPLAFLAGILEIIPNIGPTLSAVPAILVAWGISPVLALAVAALYFVIQQVENNFLVPRVMSKAVGLSPLVVIISLLAGFRLAGVTGAILAIPLVLLLEIVVSDLKKR
ncbi:MAG: AI-2E family transporter [Patescibacteria group bacterium]|nr:AI-2E family transporter [Candidatus Beckwithbacteria bacterium]MDZ4228942.1 AI-2E family transporter [Patescibacteria group bacterium]